MHLDLRSVLLLVGVMSAVIGVVLLFMRRSYPASIRGLGEWGVALLALFASTLLFGGRGLIPDVWSVIAANVLGLTGYTLFYQGSRQFFGRRPSWGGWGAVLALTTAGVAWYTLVEPHFGRRVLLVTTAFAALSFCHARVILKDGPRTFPTTFAGLALLAQGLVQVGRFFGALELPAADAIFEASLVQTIYLTAYAFVLLLSGLGVVLLATEQLLGRFRRLADAERQHLTSELLARSDTLALKARRLEELGALKDQFFTDLAHELRTPLTLVLGPLDDLADHMVSCGDAPNRSLAIVRRNALRLQELVEQLLDTARLDAGGVRLHVRRADLGAFLRRVGDRFLAEFQRRELSLDVDAGASAPPLYFDTDLLDKVMTNLLGNAAKFTPAGGHVRVVLASPPDTVETEASLVSYARVSVIDTGVGLSEAEVRRLFERFYQADGSPGGRRVGSGLGLSLARGLIELHGGQMGVTSRPGQGTTFWFTLPAGSAHLAPDEIALEAALEDRGATAGRSDARPPVQPETDVPGLARGALPLVLVVEDNDDMRAYLAEHLASVGRVVEAPEGRTALDLAARLRPQVIVSDVMMPQMDGIALGRALRADPVLRTTRLLLVSAKAGPDDRLEALGVADDHVTKPFRMQEVLARVRNLLARPAGSFEAVDAAAAAPARPAVEAEEPQGCGDAECDRALVEQMRAAVLANLPDPDCSVPCLARAVGLSPRQLQRRCRDVTGKGPLEFIRDVRMDAARDLVARGAYGTVAEVAAAVGLSRSYFTRLYTAWHGRPPSDDLRDA